MISVQDFEELSQNMTISRTIPSDTSPILQQCSNPSEANKSNDQIQKLQSFRHLYQSKTLWYVF